MKKRIATHEIFAVRRIGTGRPRKGIPFISTSSLAPYQIIKELGDNFHERYI
jgi:hypothetical protein